MSTANCIVPVEMPVEVPVEVSGLPVGLASPANPRPLRLSRCCASLRALICLALKPLRAVPRSTVGNLIQRPKSKARLSASSSLPACTFASRSRAAVCRLRISSGKLSGGLEPSPRTVSTMPETIAISIDLSPLASIELSTSPATSCKSFPAPFSPLAPVELSRVTFTAVVVIRTSSGMMSSLLIAVRFASLLAARLPKVAKAQNLSSLSSSVSSAFAFAGGSCTSSVCSIASPPLSTIASQLASL